MLRRPRSDYLSRGPFQILYTSNYQEPEMHSDCLHLLVDRLWSHSERQWHVIWWFSDLIVQKNLREDLLRYKLLWYPPLDFQLHSSGTRPMNLHFWQVSRWCCYCFWFSDYALRTVKTQSSVSFIYFIHSVNIPPPLTLSWLPTFLYYYSSLELLIFLFAKFGCPTQVFLCHLYLKRLHFILA